VKWQAPRRALQSFFLRCIIIRLWSQSGSIAMERVSQLALLSVSRGVGFAALAIGTLMVGLSSDLLTCLRAGGILTLITSTLLFMFGLQAPSRNYKQTEVWIMLNPDERPSAAVAQNMIGDALKRTYLNFALHSSLIAGGLLFLSLLIQAAMVLR
jgi:hypothetical protein